MFRRIGYISVLSLTNVSLSDYALTVHPPSAAIDKGLEQLVIVLI